ncbi:MAG: glutaredoxin family protein [Myxococcota bacterium]
MGGVRVEIFSGPDCHLCDEAKAVLEDLRRELDFELVEHSIHDDPELYERYRLEIPVVQIDGRKAFKYRVDRDDAEERITRAQRRRSSG